MSLKVLVVVDGIFNLAPSDPTDNTFTINAFLNILRNSVSPSISVDTAHRQGDPNATIAGNFNFATSIPDISVYDEIWMFGYQGSNFGGSGSLNFISDAELQAVAKFMDGGGGIFATGDHDGLGSLMCGKIPRVRSMRKWFAPTDDDPLIPAQATRNWPGSGPTRADTLQPDHNGNWNFDNQSDDVPQPLTFPGGTAHPILQGPNGPIIGFPDHMHEGEVITPWTLNDTLTFNSQQFVEYPVLAGHHEAPSIIATGKVIGGHTTPVEGSQCEQNNFSPAIDQTVANNNLAILCVYDGHNAGVGRVVTDSSFHHYIDLNVIGDPCGVGYKQQGFTMSPVLNNLTAFYINTVVWLARVVKSLSFWIDKSTFGHDEVADTKNYPKSFWLVLEGFAPAQLGNSLPVLSAPFTNINGLTISPESPVFELPGSLYTPQRILIPYDIQFSTLSLSAFPSPGDAPIQMPVNASITIQGTTVAAETVFELVSGADPYFTNIDPNQDNVFYLSQDLRIFTATPGLSPTPVPGGPPFSTNTPSSPDTNAAFQYIQDLLNHLNSTYNNPAATDPFNSVFPNQVGALTGDSSVTPTTPNPIPGRQPLINYNFAVARVRLRGALNTSAPNVKVFFRLFTTQSNDTDYQPNTTYTSKLDGKNLPASPLVGTGVETIPFFATGNLSNNSDYSANGANNQKIEISSGDSTWAYFGCFLNVYDQNNIINGQPVQVYLNGTHHCIVAQIAYDDAPIVNSNGVTMSPENSDKLAQRNLQITLSDNPGASATHRIPQTFDLRPSHAIRLDVGQLLNYPDELVIDWGNTPLGSTASIYWPQINAAEVVQLAARLYSTRLLSVSDNHTIQCTVSGGVTYVPILSGAGQNFAGLFTVDLPPTVVKGQEFNIIVRRISTRRYDDRTPRRTVEGQDSADKQTKAIRNWRYVVGTFQVKIPVKTKHVLLRPEENTLAILKWRLSFMSPTNRWRPVLERYISYISARVDGLGGNAGSIEPSPLGAAPGTISPGGGEKGERTEYTGKVGSLIYDRFGDFKGFLIITEAGHERAFLSREDEVEELIRFAWINRVVISVLVNDDEPHHPAEFVLRRAPQRRDD